MNAPDIAQVRHFWEANPLCAKVIPFALGTTEYFEYYDTLREANEPPAFSRRLHEYGNFRGRRVLDVGCGNGYVLSGYAREGAEVCGVDITSAATMLSRRRFELLGIEGSFCQANAEELPFPNDIFDCVCSMGVLHHTPDTRRAVDEIRRVLRPGGRLIIMLYHRDSALYRLGFPLMTLITGKNMQQLVNEVDGAGNPKGEVWSRAQTRDLLRGFERLDMFAGLLRGEMLVPLVGRLIPRALLRPFETRWGWFLYAKACKACA